MKNKIIYGASVIFAVLLLVLGYLAVRDGYNIQYGESSEYLRAKITEITKVDEVKPYENSDYSTTTYHFKAEIKSGDRKGDTVKATQLIDSAAMYNANPVEDGDTIIIYQSRVGDESSWVFAEFVRSDAIIVLAVLFCVAIVIFGRIKGLKTLVTLFLTIGSVFFVLIPAIIGGRNIYLWTIVVCLYITAMTLVIVNGISFMSLVGAIGCMGGVLISAAITLVIDQFIKLTGHKRGRDKPQSPCVRRHPHRLDRSCNGRRREYCRVSA